MLGVVLIGGLVFSTQVSMRLWRRASRPYRKLEAVGFFAVSVGLLVGLIELLG
jgi:hypothetical protein